MGKENEPQNDDQAKDSVEKPEKPVEPPDKYLKEFSEKEDKSAQELDE